MGTRQEIPESLAFVNNASHWPKYDGYRSLAKDSGKAEIRLIDLCYDLDMARINCTFKHVDINAPTHDSYFALSYYWGAPGVARSIYINGTKVEIRKTVYDLLKALGRLFGRLTIWLDVLCINQQDVDERSQQVSMMLEIFAKANKVLAWFGKGGADANLLFESIEAFQRNGSQALETASHTSVPKMVAYARQLLQHPYFTRVWIIQEFIVAQSLYILCGANMMEWHLFMSIIEQFEKSTTPSTALVLTAHLTIPELSHARKLSDLRNDYLQGKRCNLADLQRDFSGSACEDPRDLLYGLHGLAKERNEIVVDYSQSIIHVLLQAVVANNNVTKPPHLRTWGHWVFEAMKFFPVNSDDILRGLQNTNVDRLSFDVLISEQSKIQTIIAELPNDDNQAAKKTVIEDPSHPMNALIIYSSESLEPQDVFVKLETPELSGQQSWNLALILRNSENHGHSVVDVVFWFNESLGLAAKWVSMQRNVRQEQKGTTMMKILPYLRRELRPDDIGRLPQISWSLNYTLKSNQKKLREIYLRDGFKICQKSTAPNVKIHFSRAALFAATCDYNLGGYYHNDEKSTFTKQEEHLRRERWEALLDSIESKIRQNMTNQRLCYC